MWDWWSNLSAHKSPARPRWLLSALLRVESILKRFYERDFLRVSDEKWKREKGREEGEEDGTLIKARPFTYGRRGAASVGRALECERKISSVKHATGNWNLMKIALPCISRFRSH
jgi:hypothetical protein